MLDIIRKKASAWGTKIIFGIIIVVFIFFFGYNRISQRYKGAKGNIVAKVGSASITRPEYQMAYDNTYKMYQNIFKTPDGNLPEGVEKSVSATALNQLIQQTVIQQIGEKLGAGPSEFELADTIRNSPVAKNDRGEFDPLLYKQRFLPYFSQKFNLDYEHLVAGDIIAQKVRDIFASSAKEADPRPLYDLQNTKWNFEVSAFDTEALAKAGKSAKPNKFGGVTISSRSQLFPEDVGAAAWGKVFSLTPAKPVLAEPIKVADKWYMVKLTKLEKPTDAQWEKGREDFIKQIATQNEQSLFQSWISAALKKSNVKKYIE